MTPNKHYIIVGLFMIVGVIAMLFIGFWLSFGLNTVKLNNYMATFHTPVDGLTMNADVKFNGVSIGSVSHIRIDKKTPGDTVVTLAIQAGTPITTNTYAILKAQGITGLSYIGLQINDKEPSTTFVEPTDQAPYPDIPTRPSLFSSISNQIADITEDIDTTARHIALVFSKKNVQHLSQTLENIDSITTNIASNNQQISNSLASIDNLLSMLSKNSKKYDKLMDNVTETSASITKATSELYKMSEKINNQTLQGINQTVLPSLTQSINQLNSAAAQADLLFGKLNKNPAVLVRGQKPLQPGPGEE